MKRVKFILALTMLIAISNLLALVDPQVGQSVWTILNNLRLESDCRNPTLIPDPQGGTYTIISAGNYQLIEDSTGQIVIDANDVCLNLNCFGLAHSDASEHVVSINSNKKNVKIHHGQISNTAPGSGCGILVNDGCSFIQADHVRISDCGNGIRLDGQNGSEVKNSKVMACDFVGNTTGLVLCHADENIVKNCCCLDGLQAGYELLHSKVNCVTECKAINTMSANLTAVSFISKNGRSNMFKDCVAKKTETDAWEFCNKSYGFLLTGTEEKTKIIDCIVNETDVTSTVSAVSYGIHLDPVLLEVDDLLSLVDDNSSLPDNSVLSVAWSPNEKYIAVGDLDFIVHVFGFDGVTLTHIDDVTSTRAILSVAWSPNGKYITIGDNDGSVQVFGFDGVTLSQIDSLLLDFDDTSIPSVAWSPNGKYIVAGSLFNKIWVLSFDGVTLTKVDSDTTPDARVNSVTWSPTGKYIASGDDGDKVRVFSFDGAVLVQIDSSSLGGDVDSVAWSPNGKFIATADSVNEISVFGFDGSTLVLIDNDSTPIGIVSSIAWSPNGKYITSGDSNDDVHVFNFDGTSMVHIKDVALTGNVNSVAWSSSGKYIASGDSNRFVSVFSAMFGPENNLIKGNCVCDTAAFGQFVGTGITGSVANNTIISNACHNNEVNFSWGIPNTYDFLTTTTGDPTDNISCNC